MMLRETQKCKCACCLLLAVACVCDCKIARMLTMARSTGMIALGQTREQIRVGQLKCGRSCKAQPSDDSYELLVQLNGLWRCHSESQLAVR